MKYNSTQEHYSAVLLNMIKNKRFKIYKPLKKIH